MQQLPWQAFVCAVPVGLLASAILVVNNVRDLETDRRAGKRTLAVRLGGTHAHALRRDAGGRVRDRPAAMGARIDDGVAAAQLGGDPARDRVVRTVRTQMDGPSLNGALAKTGMLQLVFCLLFAAGILASGGIGS